MTRARQGGGRPLARFANRVLAVFVLGAVTVGCGSGPRPPAYPSARLAGAVTVDGQPVAKGVMQFLPPEGSPAAVIQAEIIDGRYTATAVPLGKVRVLFSAVKETGRVDSKSTSEPIHEVVNLIPERHRDGMDIQVTGDNDGLNFELKSK
jgi:hypothetical protein